MTALGVAMLALAQEAASPTLTIQEDSQWGPYLADSEGIALYTYALDEGGVSACTDEDCVRNWPPYIVTDAVTYEEGINPQLVGTYERDEGSLQATYNGWPLYYNARDEEPGNIRGQALGEVFYLMGPVGNAVDEMVQVEAAPDDPEAQQQGQEAAQEGEGDAAEADAPEGGGEAGAGEGAGAEQAAGAPAGQDAELEAVMAQGQQLFGANCQACHGNQGQGLVGPALNGNGFLSRDEQVVSTILNGRLEHGMPAFRDQFDDEQVASVATFIRNAWDNDFGPVTPDQAAQYR